MISLKIDQPGLTITIPGIKSARTPAVIDISRVDIRVVIMYLKSAGVIDYQIIAEKNKEVEVYTRDDFEEMKYESKNMKQEGSNSNLEKRFERIENLLVSLISEKNSGKSKPDLEQINEKLKSIENNFKLLSDIKLSSGNSSKLKDVIIEEMDEIQSFIPEINITDMKMQTQNIKTITQEGNVSSAVDALAFLQKNGGK
jgi:uncharacterized protein YggU (UPF0235/DUF167 family)